MAQHVKKGDTVFILSGKNQGAKGKVIRVLPDKGKIVVENINIQKRHQRPTQKFQGGIIEKPGPIAQSKAMVVCPHCRKPTRVKFGSLKEGKKVRFCKKCNEVVDKIK